MYFGHTVYDRNEHLRQLERDLTRFGREEQGDLAQNVKKKAHQGNISALVMISVNEASFAKKALLEGVRVDRRVPTAHREVHFEFGSERGHAIVHLGQTKVLAVVSAQVTRPYPDRPLEGLLGIYVESMTHPSREDWEDSTGQLVTRLLERLFKNSRSVDTESLCILPGEQVWSIRLDVHIMDDDGNVVDAATLAALAALLDFRRLDSSVIDGKAVIYSAFDKHPVPLTIQFQPISSSFSIFDLSEGTTSSTSESIVQLVSDPTKVEEDIASGRIILAVNRQGEIISLVKIGGLAVNTELITDQCLSIAKARAAALADRLTAELAPRK